MWAETNTVECFDASPREEGVDCNLWRKYKNASEQYLDSFSRLMNVFRPHAVVMTHWDPGAHFLDVPLDWKDYGEHQSHAFYEPTQTQVFAMGHPGWMNRKGLHGEAVAGIVNRVRKQLPGQMGVNNG